MNDRLNREETIFHAAIDLAPEKRAAYLALACGGDESLRGRVEALLQAEAEADPFFRKQPWQAAMGAEPQGLAFCRNPRSSAAVIDRIPQSCRF